MLEEYGDIEIKDDKITLPSGEIFQIRRVDWEEDKAIAANIAANNPHISGAFTPDLLLILEEIEINTPELFQELNLEPLKLDLGETYPKSREMTRIPPKLKRNG